MQNEYVTYVVAQDHPCDLTRWFQGLQGKLGYHDRISNSLTKMCHFLIFFGPDG